MSWYDKPIAEVFALLETSERGLSDAEARSRLERYGPNVIEKGERRSALAMLAGQFTDFMIVLLIVAALISAALGEVADAVAIGVILVLNAVIGFAQEYRAERAIEALSELAAQEAVVVRGGRTARVDARTLVPGDIVLLEAGAIVPADLRLTEVASLRVNESVLTGESYAVEKQTEPIVGPSLPLGDQACLAFKGTAVVYGRGRGVVIATGSHTELGRIATLLRETEEEKTPLQRRLARFGKQLSVVAVAICAVVFAVGVWRGERPADMFLIAVSLAVAAVPEGLPAVVSIALALGARAMVREHALIKHLPAVETLGSVTYICTDKTGTLTLNEMRVDEVYLPRGDGAAEGSRELLVAFMAVNNDATLGPEGATGDPLEVALLAYARDAGFDLASRDRYERVHEIPFDSARKMMTTVHRWPDGRTLAVIKGSYEAIRARCRWAVGGTGVVPFESVAGDADREVDRMAAAGLRTIAFAFRETDEETCAAAEAAHVERDLVFAGVVALVDPVRPEAAAAVREAREAGIEVVMITGDHPLTAKNIAERLGILDGGAIVTGQELAETPLEEFERAVENVRVYARVDPAQKLKIVTALQDRGQVVAMTGDGVNDAPALKKADIGVAMGRIGSDVARASARMVLLDDNFKTIVSAVREGRRIYDNVRKFVRYMLGSNSGEILTLLVAPVLGLPVPLQAIHILWINLVTDGLPGLALSTEGPEPGVMRRPPRPPQEGIFARGLGAHVIWVGALLAGLTVFAQWYALRQGWPEWQTVAFTVLCLSQMGHSLAVRSERESTFSLGLLSNLPLVGAVLLTTALQLAVIYLEPLRPVFKTRPLTGEHLVFALALSSVVFFAVELEKLLVRRFGLYERR